MAFVVNFSNYLLQATLEWYTNRRLSGNSDHVVARSHSPGPRPGSKTVSSISKFGSRSQRSTAAALEVEPSPFFEPMIRCFLLGVSFGGLFEALTVLSQVRPGHPSSASACSQQQVLWPCCTVVFVSYTAEPNCHSSSLVNCQTK